MHSAIESITNLVARNGRLDTHKPDTTFSALRKVLSETVSEEEQKFFGEYLRDGIHVANTRDGLQRRFRELLVERTDLEGSTTRSEITEMQEAAESSDQELADRLDRILRMEAVLAPAMALFDFMLTCHHRRIDDIEEELKSRWGEEVPNIHPEGNQDLLNEVRKLWSDRIPACFDRCQKGLLDGRYSESLHALLDWHASVKKNRGGAPWVQLEADGKLDVRYRVTERALPSADELSELWRNPYFIDSLKAITLQLRNGK